MKILEGLFIFDGDKEKFEKFGCVIEIKQDSGEGICINGVMVPPELWCKLRPKYSALQ